MHRIVSLPEVGNGSLDVQNPTAAEAVRRRRVARRQGSLRRAGPCAAARAAALVAAKAAAYQRRPHLARGWWWAVSHQVSEACGAARESSFVEWITVHGSAQVRGLREWGRRGTGRGSRGGSGGSPAPAAARCRGPVSAYGAAAKTEYGRGPWSNRSRQERIWFMI